MSKSKDYTIETVLSSSKEYGSGSVDGRIVTSQAPFGLRPYMARFRNSCVPYMAGPTTALGYGLRNCDPTIAPIPPSPQTINLSQIASTANVYAPTMVAGSVTISLPQITSTSNVYTPSITAASTDINFYTQIVSASNPHNSSSMHVGSVYLGARTYTTMSAMLEAPAGAVGGSTSHIELKRSTNGITLMSASTQNIPEVWFKLDEGTGTSITSSNGLYSGSFQAGSTALSWESASYSTGSYSIFFDQSSDYVTPPTTIWPTSSDDMATVAFWARMRGDVADDIDNTVLFDAVDSSNNRIFRLHLPWSDGVVYYDCGNDGGSSYDRLTYDWGASHKDDTQWHHWAFTKKISTGQMRIYLDGVDVANSTGNTKTFDTTTTTRIGTWYAASNYFWAGNLSDFAIWNTELSASDVATLYNDGSGSAPSAISSSNITVLYPFQEGTGATCYDKSGNSRDGTITNSHWALADPTPQPRTFVNFPDDASSYIQSDYNVNYTTGSSPGPISVSTWVQFNNAPQNWDAIMTFDDLTLPSGWTRGWGMYWYNNEFRFFIAGGGGAEFTGVDANFAQKQWNHIVGTWDNSTIKIYVNGVLGSGTDSFSGAMITEGCELQLGDAFNNTSAGLDGKLDDVKIWAGKALTQEEVTAIYNERTISKTSWENVTTSSVTVSSADWYDIYISASGNPATSSIRGFYYEY
jgi:hypothetical protein